MNQQSITALLAVVVAAAIAGCGTTSAVQPQASAPKAEPVSAVASPQEAAPKPASAPSPGAATESGKPEPAEAKPAAASSPPPAKAPEKLPEPITGAFGLTLGDRFAPAMVTRVLNRKEHGYRDRNKLERKGTLHNVEPKVPHEAFSEYVVATTGTGIIYSVGATHADPDKKSKCDVTRRLADELAARHGKPRGMGSRGNWYAFRDMSVKEYRGVRLYATQCRSGRYSIVYTDDAMKSPPPPGR
jgi:hypothetical protein